MSSLIVGQSYDLLLKMVVIGGTYKSYTDSGVGKTNLLSRFQKNEFSIQSKPTIGVQFATKTVAFQSHKIKVQIWDTAGQERFRAITHAYYKGASGALIVFDLTRRSTFENISKWLKQLKENAAQNIVSILIGNKSDLTETRGVKLEEIQKFAQQNNLGYLETSAKQNHNVFEAFHKVIEQIYFNQIKNTMQSYEKPKKDEKNKGPLKTDINRIQLKSKGNASNEKLESRKKKCC